MSIARKLPSIAKHIEPQEKAAEPIKAEVKHRPIVGEISPEDQAIRDQFIKNRKAEGQARLDNTDSEYWFCIGFSCREQKEEFLRKSGLMAHGDKYINGEDLARLMGITLETATPKLHSKFNFSKKLLKYARALKE